MRNNYWLERWKNNQIDFHLSGVNPLLECYWPQLNIAQQSNVFVPLCGKSVDLLWLANKGYHVIGIELSQIACEAFFLENKLSFSTKVTGEFTLFYNERITLYCGDFFALTAEMLPPLAAIYDRAALIALPDELRQRYANHLNQFMNNHCQMLLIVFDFPKDMVSGPPYPVSFEEVNQLYKQPVNQLARIQTHEKNYNETYEVVYALKK